MRESDEKSVITCKVTSTYEPKLYTEVSGKHTLIYIYIYYATGYRYTLSVYIMQQQPDVTDAVSVKICINTQLNLTT